MPRTASRDHHDDLGFTLVEILLAIVLVGILSSVAIIGIGNVVGTASKSACGASADAARAASVVYFAFNSRYPANLLELTTAGTTGAPLVLPSGVSPSPILTTTTAVSSGTSWTMTMTSGAPGAAPTFVCT